MDIPERQGTWTLADLLGQFFRSEQVEKTCEKCQCTTASVQHEVLTLPKVLVLHMKRFVPDMALQIYKKCFYPVRIDQHLHIGRVCADKLEASGAHSEVPKPYYKLHGIVRHVGATMAVGHYVADTKAADGTWTHFNDAIAFKFESRDLQSPERQNNVYLAMYALCT